MTEDDIDEAAPEYSKADLERIGAKWLDRIKDATKRDETEWSGDAEVAQKAYLGDGETLVADGNVYDFNIFHSNVETIAPAIYNSTPIPEIRERFRTGNTSPETAAARVAAQIIERAIMVQIDDGALDTEVEAQIQDALVAGRGVMRLRFDADEDQVQPPPMMDAMGQVIQPPPQTVIVNERIKFEAVSWRDYCEGPAKRWEDVPWVAYRHNLPHEQVEKIRDPALREILSAGGADQDGDSDDADTQIWEIWCRDSNRVYMVVEASGEVLSIVDDPLGLTGFFPSPRPIQPITASGCRRPVVPFSIYRKLADELDLITKRIAAITEGLKVRGFIAGNVEDWENLSGADDNTLVPIANLEALAQTGGIDKAISWWPVQQAIAVLQQLYVNREATKNMIYEITGISDIVRGQGKASETATAQEIKSQWGGLRVRKLQRQVERSIRDVFVMCAEIINSKFGPQTLRRMTGVRITPDVAQMFGRPLDGYRIDVESDSTVRADLSRRKGEMGEFLQGTGAFFQAMTPVVQAAPAMAGPVAQLFAAFARQFNLGKQGEDAIEEMAQIAGQQAQQAQQMQAQNAQMQREAQAKADAREDAKTQADVAAKMAQAQGVQARAQIDQGRLVLDERKAEIDGLTKLAGDYANG